MSPVGCHGHQNPRASQNEAVTHAQSEMSLGLAVSPETMNDDTICI